MENSAEQEKFFRRAQTGNGGVPAGSRGGFARGVRGLPTRLFPARG